MRRATGFRDCSADVECRGFQRTAGTDTLECAARTGIRREDALSEAGNVNGHHLWVRPDLRVRPDLFGGFVGGDIRKLLPVGLGDSATSVGLAGASGISGCHAF